MVEQMPTPKRLTPCVPRLSADVAADLARHEPAIRRALEQELVVHLYNTTGQFKHGLQQDAVALKAVELLESDVST